MTGQVYGDKPKRDSLKDYKLEYEDIPHPTNKLFVATSRAARRAGSSLHNRFGNKQNKANTVGKSQ